MVESWMAYYSLVQTFLQFDVSFSHNTLRRGVGG